MLFWLLLSTYFLYIPAYFDTKGLTGVLEKFNITPVSSSLEFLGETLIAAFAFSQGFQYKGREHDLLVVTKLSFLFCIL